MRTFAVVAAAFALAVSAAPAKAARWTGPPVAQKARAVALHGGILCTRHGCSTRRMQALMVRVYEERFASAGPWAQRTAVCLMKAESGGNPGAISDTGDYSGSQLNRVAHEPEHPEWYRPGRGFRYLIFDPWKSASAMWSMSSAGRNWSAWTGTYGRGICR